MEAVCKGKDHRDRGRGGGAVGEGPRGRGRGGGVMPKKVSIIKYS